MLPLKKNYIDTRFKTSDSTSNSNFKIDLPSTVYWPDNTVFFIDDVAIPHIWHTIEENVNDKLYVFIKNKTYPAEDIRNVQTIITIPYGNYSGADLATQLQTSLGTLLVVNYDARRNNIIITTAFNDQEFKILTDNDLLTKLDEIFLLAYDVNNPQTINEILRNAEGNSIYYNSTNPYVSGSLDLQPIRNIYMHSPNLTSFKTVGPLGENTIIKKIPVTSDYNTVIFDQVMTSNDYIDCSRQTWRRLEFQLKDSKGSTINLHGSHMSFSIIMSRMNSNS
jgi:hypothetical protein